jgi:hypothetical protein
MNEVTQDSGILFFYAKRSDNSLVELYYRAYFGKKQQLDFVEGFSMVNSEVKTIYYDGQNYKQQDKERFTDFFLLGFGLGSKWIHKRGVNSLEIVGRGGITLGYRFKQLYKP